VWLILRLSEATAPPAGVSEPTNNDALVPQPQAAGGSGDPLVPLGLVAGGMIDNRPQRVLRGGIVRSAAATCAGGVGG
jgi:hypothetical protein